MSAFPFLSIILFVPLLGGVFLLVSKKLTDESIHLDS